jgi:DNA-binding transcriptional ArsR family regulator
MRLFAEETEFGPRATAEGSIAVEIDWVLAAASRVTRSTQPALSDFYAAHPEVGERVRSLWGPDETLSYPGYLELSALAYSGGLLFSMDADLFLERLEELCVNSSEDFPFAAETPDDRMRLLRRLDLLRNDTQTRDRYIGVVTEVWLALRDLWEAEGSYAVEATVAERRAHLSNDGDPYEFAMNSCLNREEMSKLINGLGETGHLVVVPSFFMSKGMVADFPGTLVIGTAVKPIASLARARTESLARRLKAIADPTRLAILDALIQQDMSITEVTNLFGLAQPTVSNHVKQLREAGLVTSASGGRRRQLTVQRPIVDEIIGSLDRILDPDGRRPEQAAKRKLEASKGS